MRLLHPSIQCSVFKGVRMCGGVKNRGRDTTALSRTRGTDLAWSIRGLARAATAGGRALAPASCEGVLHRAATCATWSGRPHVSCPQGGGLTRPSTSTCSSARWCSVRARRLGASCAAMSQSSTKKRDAVTGRGGGWGAEEEEEERRSREG